MRCDFSRHATLSLTTSCQYPSPACRWVPVVRVGGKVCIFPGVPRLFERLVEGFVANYVTLPPSSEKPFRVLVHTECVHLPSVGQVSLAAGAGTDALASPPDCPRARSRRSSRPCKSASRRSSSCARSLLSRSTLSRRLADVRAPHTASRQLPQVPRRSRCVAHRQGGAEVARAGARRFVPGSSLRGGPRLVHARGRCPVLY